MNENTQLPESNPPENNLAEKTASEEVIFKPQNDLPFPNEVDLNELFPEEDKDLNDLFPDEETKLLLKKMQKNKKDLHTMTDRFLDEDWASDAMESSSEESSSEESATQDTYGTPTKENNA